MASKRIGVRTALVGLVLTAIFAGQLLAEKGSTDWPQFRGSNRDGISTETGLLGQWPESGPKEVWRVKLGPGYSGISIVGDRLYTMYTKNDAEGVAREHAAAFDVKTGKEIWSTPMGENYENSFGNGPRSTPAVGGKLVYVLDSTGNFAALSIKNGEKKWGWNLIEKFEVKQPFFGFSTSALIDDNLLVLAAGGPEGKAFVGVNPASGEVEWTVGDGPGENAGDNYNSPIAVSVGGERRYVYLMGDDLVCVDPEGNQVWHHDWNPQGESHASPMFVPPNQIFASGTEGIGGTLFAVDESGPEASVEQVWNTNRMRNHFSTSVQHDGVIYGFDNATLRAISVADGETAWVKRGLGKGSMILADGHLYVLSDKGALVMIEATPETYKEKGRVQALEGRCWTAPTLADGRLYLRNGDEMVVYELKQ